jgi:anti-sigma factor RsiW
MTNPILHLRDEQAQRLVDGALSVDEAAAVETHLDGCAACQGLVESYRFLGDALDGLENPELPLDFTEGVISRIETHERAVARERRAAFAICGAVLAAVIVAVVLLGAGTWAPAASRLVQELGETGRTLRLGVDVLAPVVSTLRLPIAAICAALALPIVYALSRLLPSPRTEIA